MKALSLALLCAAGVLSAQQKDTAKFCDPKSALLNSPTSFGVQRATIVKSCYSFQQGVETFKAANMPALMAMRGDSALAWLLHGPAPIVVPPTKPDTQPTPVPVDTVKPPPVSQWTRLGGDGAAYTFTGTRTVRWIRNDASKAVLTVATAKVACGFGDDFKSAPGGSGAGFCDVSPIMTRRVAVPVKMGALQSDSIDIPIGSQGSSTLDVTNAGGGASTPGQGSFRTICKYVKMDWVDPIVYSGQTGVSHLHSFWGHVNIDQNTDSASIMQGPSTCLGGGGANNTGYWIATLLDENGQPLIPESLTAYYKRTALMSAMTVVAPPAGLKLIAGSKLATGPQQGISWDCMNPKNLTTVTPSSSTIIANCPAGMILRLTVDFPFCWNGKDLDSPSHQSHVVYASINARSQWVCPDGFTTILPQITEFMDVIVPAGANVGKWHLSSDMDLSKPGISAHADWLMGHNPAILKSFIDYCLNGNRDCGVGTISATQTLK